jgi:GNAT superfamily N-acetyltransferase
MISRSIYKNEYKIIAGIHLQAFSDFFLTSLGEKFLCTYYKASIKSPESISICIVDADGFIKGFCIGCVKSNGYHKRLFINNLFPFIIQAFYILLSKPKSLIRLVSNFEKKESIDDNGNYAEILSIAVSPSCKGFGYGKSMIKCFEEEAKKKGCNKVALTTDYNNNQNVLSFYKKCGYVIFYEFTSYPKRRMYKLIKDIID